MTISVFVDDIESVDENLRDFYKPLDEGNGYVLNAEPSNGYAVENVEGLRSALGKERTERKQFQKQYETISKQFDGVDLEEIEGIRAEYEKLQKKYEKVSKIDPESEAAKLAEEKIKEFEEKANSTFSKKQKDWQKQYDTEVGALKGKNEALTAQLKGLMIDNTATNALVEAGIRQEHLELILPKVTGSIRLADDESGKLAVEVVDIEGNPRVRSDGQNMTISDLIPELQDKWPDSFNADVRRGGGMKPNKGPAGGGRETKELTSKEQIARGLAARMNLSA